MRITDRHRAGETGNVRASLRRVRPHVVAFIIAALPLVVLYAWSVGGWTSRAPQSEVRYGLNFSCKRAEYLGQACAPLFRQILTELAPPFVRVSTYWSDVEQQPGVYDFQAIDELLAIAADYNVRVTVSIGMKAQRYPEYWFPTWLRQEANLSPGGYPEDHRLIRTALLAYLRVAAAHIGAHPAVEAIQVENEPFVPSRSTANGWLIRRDFLAEEIAVVKAADPNVHPVVVSHASWTRRDRSWEWIVENADILAQSVYTKRQRGPWPWLYAYPYRVGTFTPDLPAQARATRREGKQLWLLELQAEPFEAHGGDLRRLPTYDAASFSARWFGENATLARRSGATRAYWWGVEWWLYLRDQRGEPDLWDTARALFTRQAQTQPGRTGVR